MLRRFYAITSQSLLFHRSVPLIPPLVCIIPSSHACCTCPASPAAMAATTSTGTAASSPSSAASQARCCCGCTSNSRSSHDLIDECFSHDLFCLLVLTDYLMEGVLYSRRHEVLPQLCHQSDHLGQARRAEDRGRDGQEGMIDDRSCV